MVVLDSCKSPNAVVMSRYPVGRPVSEATEGRKQGRVKPRFRLILTFVGIIGACRKLGQKEHDCPSMTTLFLTHYGIFIAVDVVALEFTRPQS